MEKNKMMGNVQLKRCLVRLELTGRRHKKENYATAYGKRTTDGRECSSRRAKYIIIDGSPNIQQGYLC